MHPVQHTTFAVAQLIPKPQILYIRIDNQVNEFWLITNTNVYIFAKNLSSNFPPVAWPHVMSSRTSMKPYLVLSTLENELLPSDVM